MSSCVTEMHSSKLLALNCYKFLQYTSLHIRTTVHSCTLTLALAMLSC